MSYSSEVLTDTPVAFWEVDEGAASATAADSSGNSLTATYSGTETTGVTPLISVGQAVTFTSGKATTASSSLFQPGTSGAMSFEAWLTSSSAATGGIICSDNGAGAGRLFQFRLSAAGLVQLIVFNATGASNVTASSSSTVNDGLRHYVVATYDGANIRIYIDCNLDTTTPCTFVGSASNHAAAFGGQLAGVTAAPFVGTLDELAFYTTVLSQARITAHAQASGVTASARLTQEAVEVLDADGTPRATQIAVEVARQVPPAGTVHGGLTQEAVETLRSESTSIDKEALTQLAVESLRSKSTTIDAEVLTQITVEVLITLPRPRRFTAQVI